jgi:hypothetical protein
LDALGDLTDELISVDGRYIDLYHVTVKAHVKRNMYKVEWEKPVHTGNFRAEARGKSVTFSEVDMWLNRAMPLVPIVKVDKYAATKASKSVQPSRPRPKPVQIGDKIVANVGFAEPGPSNQQYW